MSSDFNDRPGGGATGGTVAEFVRELRGAGGVPINFIRADEEVEVSARMDDAGADEALARLVAQTDRYRWERVEGRYVLYPADDVWRSVVSGVDIKQVPRLEAASLYADIVRGQISALGDWAGPVQKGETRSPVFTDRVSLSPSASVLVHLIELLGTDERLAFTIERGRAGPRVMHFERLAPAASDADGA